MKWLSFLSKVRRSGRAPMAAAAAARCEKGP